MKNRWVNLLFIFLCVLIGGLSYHLFVLARTKEAVGLIINILKPLNILLFSILLFVLSRNLLKLYFGYKSGAAGFRLQTRLIISLLPLTLLPSLALFFLSTSFVDDFLQRTVKSPEQTEILRGTNEFIDRHFQDVGALHLAHGPALLAILRVGDQKQALAYLDKHALQGVRYLVAGVEQLWLPASAFDYEHFSQLSQDDLFRGDPDGYEFFDDGRLLARYPFQRNDEVVEFIYCMDSSFTQRYIHLRESWIYLQYGQKKMGKLLGLNRSILLLTSTFIIFGGIWTALSFSRRFLVAFKILIEGAGRISNGDLDTKVTLKTGDEMEDVAHAFNSMTGRLKQNQGELEQKARDLGLLNTRLQSEIHYNQAIMAQRRAGILSTDGEERIRSFNPAFVAILGGVNIEDQALLTDVLSDERVKPLLRLWRAYKEQGSLSRQLELRDQHGEELFVSASVVPLAVDGARFGDLVVLEDLTELLAAQKLAAWRDVAKRVAHEIKNPLTPIQLSIQRVERKARLNAPDLLPAVQSAHETIMSETNLLKNLVNEFSTFAKMPSPLKTDANLGELISSVCVSYRPVHPQLVIEDKPGPKIYTRRVDPNQIRQVLSNLLNNAAQASVPGGRVVVGLEPQDSRLLLYVDDEGSGIPANQRENVFLPYYSRSPKGTGLGLAIVKRIVADHSGTIEALPRQPKGTRFAILFP